jgi:hypothetical protein
MLSRRRDKTRVEMAAKAGFESGYSGNSGRDVDHVGYEFAGRRIVTLPAFHVDAHKALCHSVQREA